MARDRRGEVWRVDLGYAGQTRPAVVISVPSLDTERALVALVPHTTSPRGTRFDVVSKVGFLKTGVFDAQNLVTVPEAKTLRKLGTLSKNEFDEIIAAVMKWFGLIAQP